MLSIIFIYNFTFTARPRWRHCSKTKIQCLFVLVQTATLEALPGCPLCKQPLGGVLRYGRPLARRRLDLAEGKWLAAAGRAAAKGQDALARGRAAAERLLPGMTTNTAVSEQSLMTHGSCLCASWRLLRRLKSVSVLQLWLEPLGELDVGSC